jgi:hypothetical protein
MDFTPQTVIVPYAHLVRAGLTAWQLRGSMHRIDLPWSIVFECFGPLTIEQCKEPARNYLEQAYKATAITFLKSASLKDNQFRVQFVRGDL